MYIIKRTLIIFYMQVFFLGAVEYPLSPTKNIDQKLDTILRSIENNQHSWPSYVSSRVFHVTMYGIEIVSFIGISAILITRYFKLTTPDDLKKKTDIIEKKIKQEDNAFIYEMNDKKVKANKYYRNVLNSLNNLSVLQDEIHMLSIKDFSKMNNDLGKQINHLKNHNTMINAIEKNFNTNNTEIVAKINDCNRAADEILKRFGTNPSAGNLILNINDLD